MLISAVYEDEGHKVLIKPARGLWLFQRLPMMEIQSPCVRSLYLNIPQLLSPMGERGCGIFGWICKVVAMLFLRRQYYIVTFYSWIKNIFFIKGKNTTPT